MRIRKIKYENHKVLGNIELDFTDSTGEAEDIIFLAGENGCGKTTIINDIFNIFINEKVEDNYEIEFEITDSERKKLKKNSIQIKSKMFNIIKIPNENSYYFKENDSDYKIFGSPIVYFGLNNICKCIYSLAEINFSYNKIKSVTAMELDQDIKSEMQTQDLSQKIAQLLIDIKASDAEELSDWIIKNPQKIPPEEVIEKRMRRFKNAFSYMFGDDLVFDSIKNENGYKEIYFRRKDKLIPIDQLSSGEKQIVYRGSFILKNLNNLPGSIILIDEPELSLHPIWQQKIIEYFRRMCIDETGKQICQIFVATHSPFILHSPNRKNDKVIVLKKDDLGNVFLPNKKEFYNCNSIEVIEEAFSLNKYIKDIQAYSNSTIIITEGKTDNKHIENAMKELNINDLDIVFLNIDNAWGDSRLQSLLNNLKLIKRPNKIIGIFDRDNERILKDFNLYENKYINLGNKVYAFSIPIVGDYGEKISIEHYYNRQDLLKENVEGRRIFLGEEFITKSGMSKNKKFYTKISNIKNKVDINGIIDEKVYLIDDIEAKNSIALTKDDFANLVCNNDFSSNFNFTNFQKIFDIIKEIVND